MQRKCGIASAVGLTALVIAGCGGDDEAEPTAASRDAMTQTQPPGATAETTTTEHAQRKAERDEDTAERESEDAGADAGGDDASRVRSRRRSTKRSTRSRRGSGRTERRRHRTQAPRTLTHAQAIAAGDEICAAARRDQATFAPGDSKGHERTRRRANFLKSIVERAVSQFRALREPAEGRATLGLYINTLAAQIPIFDEVAAAAAREDDTGVADGYGRITELGKKARALAGEYGFRTCGSG